MPDPIIRVADIAWIRLQSPDLEKQSDYLQTFGLMPAARTSNAVYMRGTDPLHHVHITEKGPAKVLSIAFYARAREDLDRLAAEGDGVSKVMPIDEPGGGWRVHLTEQNGLGIEVVWGVERVSALPVEPRVLNFGHAKNARAGKLMRVTTRPSQVKRIAHAVISTPDMKKSIEWGHRHLGLVTSDDVHAEGNPDELVASFNRIDDGPEYVDHHVMMFGRNAKAAGLNHVSFEVQDLDDLYIGHDMLKKRYGDLHLWGIGRHTLGSQIFDYWKDPWGRIHEHWTDSDVLNNEHPYSIHTASEGLRSQWGPQAPQEFRDAASR